MGPAWLLPSVVVLVLVVVAEDVVSAAVVTAVSVDEATAVATAELGDVADKVRAVDVSPAAGNAAACGVDGVTAATVIGVVIAGVGGTEAGIMAVVAAISAGPADGTEACAAD